MCIWASYTAFNVGWMHLHSRRTDCDISDLTHHLYCTCVALHIFSLHIAFIYTSPQTCSYQHLFNWITVILDLKHSNIDFFKSTFLHVCESILVLLCLSCTTRTAQIFICLGRGGRWTALRHTLNPPSAAASFRIERNTGRRKAWEKHTPKTTKMASRAASFPPTQRTTNVTSGSSSFYIDLLF